ncbi:hypothetical protein [Blastochloris tepida]|uniref:Uncharacterized protein n=1 Tax=Blastochloris tepida TaxID=2233851 RepID=A0A348G1B3_9HYPH|nr:hypothetical protein [Blastochloris tepida]BBF93346.1 hypothetical protein BLTE_20310 [Blastochloris tepida]
MSATMAKPTRIDLDLVGGPEVCRVATRQLDLSKTQLDALQLAGVKPLVARRRVWLGRTSAGDGRLFERSTIEALARRDLIEVTHRNARLTPRGRQLLALIGQGSRA